MKNTNPVGSSWEDFERSHFTQADIDEHYAKAEIVSELIKARNEGKITQRQLEIMSGIKQPMIARIERGVTSPTIDTLLKLLAPLGKTLKVVPLEKAE